MKFSSSGRLTAVIFFYIFCISPACSRTGLLTDSFPEEQLRIHRMLPDNLLDKNPRFVVFGDMRPGWRVLEKFLKRNNWLTWKMLIFPFYEIYWLGNGIVGGIEWMRKSSDYGENSRVIVRNAVYTAARRENADFMLAGEFVSDGRNPDNWMRFLKESRDEHPLFSEIPAVPYLSNHESANDTVFGLPNYRAVFDYPRFYVLEFPDATLIVVDSNFLLDQNQMIDDVTQEALFRTWFVSDDDGGEPAWLEKALAASDKPFKMVAMHHTLISFGHHHTDWDNRRFGNDLLSKRSKVLNVLKKYGVQIVFCGHEHNYEHNILRYRDINLRDREMHFLVSGGGGVPLRSLSRNETVAQYIDYFRKAGLDVVNAKREKKHHYCLVDITADTITIKTVEINGKSDSPDNIIEEITIRK